MKIATVQFSPEYQAKQRNINKMTDFIGRTEAKIIVFPELCTTGYFFLTREEVSAVAEPAKGNTIRHFQEISTDSNKILIFGFPESDGQKLYNSGAIIFPHAEDSRIYRKTHLFYKEKYCFDPGDTGFMVIEDRDTGIRIGTMICYDWRFPESARSLGLLGADLIVCPACLITTVWHLAMPARALENKVYLAVANRTGTELNNGEEVYFNGQSGIWDYNGSLMCKAGADEENVLIADIEPKKTRNKSFNELNNIFKDRRPEMYVVNREPLKK